HKAAGWMLREVWKKGYRDELRDFLDNNVTRMPSVMLSYACEQMSADERHEWQSKRKATADPLTNKNITTTHETKF
ncbi:MAG: DNA alkylation repair protein, partial [Firmicutes bacterium]|nr:DNA alkylation repair protein [Bacillota bacterium]